MEHIRKFMCAVTASLLILCKSGCRNAERCYMEHQEENRWPSYSDVQHVSGSICKIYMFYVWAGNDDGVPCDPKEYYIDFFTGKGLDDAGNEIDLLEYTKE